MHLQVLAFLPVAVAVTRSGLQLGRSGAHETASGTVCGLLVQATATVLGLSAIVATSARAFLTLKLLGACYVIVLGALTLSRARLTPLDNLSALGHPTPRVGCGHKD
jgi:threonine/homoserine/homoserine lactone efflux protein